MVQITGTLRGECEDGKSCPKMLDTDGPGRVLVQGERVAPSVHETAGVPAHEALVSVPRSLLPGLGGIEMNPCGVR